MTGKEQDQFPVIPDIPVVPAGFWRRRSTRRRRVLWRRCSPQENFFIVPGEAQPHEGLSWTVPFFCAPLVHVAEGSQLSQ